jgi:hypothetical protein
MSLTESIGKDLELYLIFPVHDNNLDLDELDCVPHGQDVDVVEDEELDNAQVIELAGSNCKISFFPNCAYPCLIFHINSTGRFVHITIITEDSNGVERTLQLSNNRSTLEVKDNSCKLPMEIGEGWQYLNINCDFILSKTFGTRLNAVLEVTVSGVCRMAKMFMEGEEYADAQLPPFLRVLPST